MRYLFILLCAYFCLSVGVEATEKGDDGDAKYAAEEAGSVAAGTPIDSSENKQTRTLFIRQRGVATADPVGELASGAMQITVYSGQLKNLLDNISPYLDTFTEVHVSGGRSEDQEDPPSIAGIENLKNLRKFVTSTSSTAHLNDAQAKILATVPGLKVLEIPINRFSVEGIKLIATIKGLEYLDLTFNNIGFPPPTARIKRILNQPRDTTDKSFAKMMELVKLTNLRELRLRENYLTDKSITKPKGIITCLTCGEAGSLDFSSWKNLWRLDVSRNRCGVKWVSAIIRLPELTELNLSANDLDDSAVEPLITYGRLSKLRQLDLSDNKRISPSTLIRIVQALPKLVKFKSASNAGEIEALLAERQKQAEGKESGGED